MILDIWVVLGITTKFALYVSVLLSCGAVLFRMVFREAEWGAHLSVRPTVLWFSVLGVVASTISYALRGAALTGDATGLTDPEMLGLLWETPVGTALGFRVWGFGLMIASLLFPRGGRFLALGGVAFVLWSFGQIGHATRFEFPWLAVILSIHLAGLAFWVGVLSPLFILSKDQAHLKEAAELAHRFGQIAATVIPVLLVAGVIFAWNLLGSFMGLMTTPYGWALLVKIALVGGLLGMAALNKLRIVPALVAGSQDAAEKLRRVMTIEAGIIAVILLITAILTSVLSVPE